MLFCLMHFVTPHHVPMCPPAGKDIVFSDKSAVPVSSTLEQRMMGMLVRDTSLLLSRLLPGMLPTSIPAPRAMMFLGSSPENHSGTYCLHPSVLDAATHLPMPFDGEAIAIPAGAACTILPCCPTQWVPRAPSFLSLVAESSWFQGQPGILLSASMPELLGNLNRLVRLAPPQASQSQSWISSSTVYAACWQAECNSLTYNTVALEEPSLGAALAPLAGSLWRLDGSSAFTNSALVPSLGTLACLPSTCVRGELAALLLADPPVPPFASKTALYGNCSLTVKSVSSTLALLVDVLPRLAAEGAAVSCALWASSMLPSCVRQQQQAEAVARDASLYALLKVAATEFPYVRIHTQIRSLWSYLPQTVASLAEDAFGAEFYGKSIIQPKLLRLSMGAVRQGNLNVPMTSDPLRHWAVTGGLGALGLLAADWMVGQGRAYITLLGRSGR